MGTATSRISGETSTSFDTEAESNQERKSAAARAKNNRGMVTGRRVAAAQIGPPISLRALYRPAPSKPLPRRSRLHIQKSVRRHERRPNLLVCRLEVTHHTRFLPVRPGRTRNRPCGLYALTKPPCPPWDLGRTNFAPTSSLTPVSVKYTPIVRGSGN